MSSAALLRPSFSVLLCFFALSGTPRANVGKTAEQEAEQKASPEMDRLKKLYLGSWDYTETYTRTPFAPQYIATQESPEVLMMRVDAEKRP